MIGRLSENRAEKRSAWPMAVRRLQDSDPATMPDSTAQERLAAVAELTSQSWSLAGLDVPDYPRHATPVKRLHLRDLRRTPPAK